MRDLCARWQRTLLTPVDVASVAVFRIAFGAMVAIDALRYLSGGKIDEHFIRPVQHFTYLYLDFVQPFPGRWMYGFFWVLFALAVLVSVGLFYRVAIVLLFLTYSYFFLLEQAIYMNHYYLIALLAFLLIWIPAHRAFSVDCRLRDLGPPVVPFAAVAVLRFQLLVMYSYGAIAKLNPDWLRGEPMHSILLGDSSEVPEIARIMSPKLLAYGIALGGIVADAAIPLLLAFRRTVIIGFVYACIFHILNAIFLNIGIFSYLAMAAITIFFAPDWPRRWIGRDTAVGTTDATASPLALSPSLRRMLVALHIYMAFQLLFPFRHLLFPGVVSWTEEGHRFAWHMKLRRKHSFMAIHAYDPTSGRRWQIDPRDDLRARQLRKLGTFPDIMLQYVHHHRDRLRAEGVRDPVITVDWFCSLNGRPYQRLVDPTVNLAAVERTWRHSPWIIPLSDSPDHHATEAELHDQSLVDLSED
jgi:vitamin K-dependent gamma-carboxylase